MSDIKALRKEAVAYMRSMSSIRWTPAEDIDLTSILKTLYYKKGETYYGVIYNTNRGVDGETFSSHIENGVFKGPTDKPSCPGNHCTSSILITWRKLGDKTTAGWTANMMPQCGTGILSLGNYEWKAEDKTTIEMVERTEPEVLFEDYALMQEGDAILYCFGPTGHARMIVENHVVRTADGKIDPEESHVITIEQTSSFDKQRTEIHTTWYVDHKYSYNMLRKSNYVPITVPIFQQ